MNAGFPSGDVAAASVDAIAAVDNFYYIAYIIMAILVVVVSIFVCLTAYYVWRQFVEVRDGGSTSNKANYHNADQDRLPLLVTKQSKVTD